MRKRYYKIQRKESINKTAIEEFRTTSPISTLSEHAVIEIAGDDDERDSDFNEWMVESLATGGWYDTDTSMKMLCWIFTTALVSES